MAKAVPDGVLEREGSTGTDVVAAGCTFSDLGGVTVPVGLLRLIAARAAAFAFALALIYLLDLLPLPPF